MSLPHRRIVSAVLLSLALALGACGPSGEKEETLSGQGEVIEPGSGESEEDAADDASGTTINLKPTTFEPADVSIKVGESVTWKWGGGVQHDVEGDGFKSKVQGRGTFSHTFAEPGTFDYKCNVHPATMKGTVTVA